MKTQKLVRVGKSNSAVTHAIEKGIPLCEFRWSTRTVSKHDGPCCSMESVQIARLANGVRPASKGEPSCVSCTRCLRGD